MWLYGSDVIRWENQSPWWFTGVQTFSSLFIHDSSFCSFSRKSTIWVLICAQKKKKSFGLRDYVMASTNNVLQVLHFF